MMEQIVNALAVPRANAERWMMNDKQPVLSSEH